MHACTLRVHAVRGPGPLPPRSGGGMGSRRACCVARLGALRPLTACLPCTPARGAMEGRVVEAAKRGCSGWATACAVQAWRPHGRTTAPACFTTRSMSARLDTSSCAVRHVASSGFSVLSLLEVAHTMWPRAASSLAKAWPMPLPAPVTRHTRLSAGGAIANARASARARRLCQPIDA